MEVYNAPGAVGAGRLDRQDSRFMLRNGLRKITELKRLKSCGLPIGSSDVIMKQLEGVHHFVGISTCGSGWACPVCSAKIRFKRANEISKAVVSALDQGCGALFVTRTIPHSAEDQLQFTLNLLAEGRRWVSSQLAVKKLRKHLNYLGGIASKEVTHTFNGWHPHTHDIELFGQKVQLQELVQLNVLYYELLNKFYVRNGHKELSKIYGVTVEPVNTSGDALGKYLSKLQEGASVSNEMARADLKIGRNGSMMPFDIIADFFNTGDCDMLALWFEFERDTKGKSVIRFTKDLRALFLPDEAEKSDEEIAAEEVGGVDVVKFDNWFFRRIISAKLEGKVLAALDAGGFPALVELLTVYHLDSAGGYYQMEGLTDENTGNSGTFRQN